MPLHDEGPYQCVPLVQKSVMLNEMEFRTDWFNLWEQTCCKILFSFFF